MKMTHAEQSRLQEIGEISDDDYNLLHDFLLSSYPLNFNFASQLSNQNKSAWFNY